MPMDNPVPKKPLLHPLDCVCGEEHNVPTIKAIHMEPDGIKIHLVFGKVEIKDKDDDDSIGVLAGICAVPVEELTDELRNAGTAFLEACDNYVNENKDDFMSEALSTVIASWNEGKLE